MQIEYATIKHYIPYETQIGNTWFGTNRGMFLYDIGYSDFLPLISSGHYMTMS